MSGKSLLIYICNFHVLSHLLLIYICKLHWMCTNRRPGWEETSHELHAAAGCSDRPRSLQARSWVPRIRWFSRSRERRRGLLQRPSNRWCCRVCWQPSDQIHSESQAHVQSGESLMIYIWNFHVLSHLLLIYICKLHWNVNTMFVCQVNSFWFTYVISMS